MSQKTFPLIQVVIGFLVLATAVVAWGLFQKSQLDRSSQELAIRVTQSIFFDNDIEPLVRNAHPALIEQYTADGLRAVLSNASEILGPLELIESISGTSNMSLVPFSATQPTANYVLSTSFDENQTPIYIAMVWEDEAWRFTEYRIDSPLLYS
ncbi:MAG: hypothetical protein GKR91_04575 [Pseudomonadales bacterium]|nr:hypothetical protein [Pseudomonadales bacterium]